MANHGPWNARSVAGHLYLTDRRLIFRPTWIERLTQERGWETTVHTGMIAIGPGQWPTRIPVIRHFALRYEIDVLSADGSEEHFFVTHLGAPIESIATHRDDEPGLGA